MIMTDYERTKYPRTAHLPTSEGSTSDDKWASKETLAYLASGINLVVSEKMDGGNLTFTRSHFYGRSMDSTSNPWDIPAKALWASLRHDIPEGWRLSGESMYARRSVSYDRLEGLYIVFGIWDETNTLLAWDDMVEWCELLGLPTAPVLYRGTDFKEATSVWKKTTNSDVSEGFVVRDSGRITYEDFPKKFAKHVRANHVRTAANWRNRDDFALNGITKK